MQKYQNNYQDDDGNALVSAIVTVFLTGTLTKPALFADDETTPKTNPLVTDQNGMYEFKADDGVFDIKHEINNFTTIIFVGVQLLDGDDIQTQVTINTAAIATNTDLLSVHDSEITALQIGATGSFTYAQDTTPNALNIGETWLKTDDGDVFVATATGTGNWLFSYSLIIATPGMIGDINSPLVDFDTQNSLNLVRGVGAPAFTRSTIGTYVDRYGVVQTAAIDEPRFEKEGLLIEPAATNLVLRSEEFDNGVWSLSDATLVANAGTAPDGNLTADNFIPDNGVNSSFVVQTFPTVSGEPYTMSCFAELNGSLTTLTLLGAASGFSDNVTAVFNLLTGDITETPGAGTITSSGLDEIRPGIFRLHFTALATATANPSFQIRHGPVGDGVSGFLIWGAQVEKGPLSSYIKTEASTVTRTTDNLSLQAAGNVGLASAEKTYIVDFSVNAHADFDQELLRLIGPSFNIMRASTIGSNLPTAFKDGTGVPLAGTPVIVGITQRAGFVITQTGLKTYLNGIFSAERTTDVADDQIPTSIRLGGEVNTSVFGHIKLVRIYGRALLSTEMRIA